MVMRLFNSFFWMYMSPNAIWPFMENFIFQQLYHGTLRIQLGKWRSKSNLIIPFDSMIQDNTKLWNNTIMTKPLMKYSMGWLYNSQPTTLQHLMHFIPRPSGTFLLTVIVSYQRLIFNTEKTFNNDCKISDGSFILFSVWMITIWKRDHWISSKFLLG